MTGWLERAISPHALLARTDPSFLYLLAFLLALLLALGLIHRLRSLAPRLRLVDPPGRMGRAHVAPAAKVGGLGLGLAIGLVLLLAFPATDMARRYVEQAAQAGPILLGAAAMALLGLWDDLRDLRPRTKLLFQTLAALAVFTAGVRVASVGLPGLGSVEFGAFGGLLLTLLWFVGITNAFNLVDGADGVAGGAALTASVGMFVVALVLDQPLIALVLAATAGAVLGFLYFNFPPASVFLGDAGSLSLGFLFAGLGLASSSKATTVLAIAIPVVSLGLPVLDTALAIARRVLKGQGVATADLGHVHHRLRAHGRSPRQVALILLAIGAVFALTSLLLLTPDLRAVGLAFAIVGTVVFVFVQRLRVPEFVEMELALRREMRRRDVIARNVAIREAAARLAEQDSWPGVADLLASAFERTDWEEAELRLDALPAARDAMGAGSGAGREGGSHIWRWRRDGTHATGLPAQMSRSGRWEIALPVVDPTTSRVAGTLRVWRALDDRMPPDLHVVARVLMPALVEATRRLRSASEPIDLRERRPAGAGVLIEPEPVREAVMVPLDAAGGSAVR